MQAHKTVSHDEWLAARRALLAGALPFWRDHFICLVGTGLRAGELLGLRAHRVDLTRRRNNRSPEREE